MKNKFLAILILASVNECFSQDSGEANRLNTTINPYESRGYLHWESEPDEYYLVTIMHKDDQNQFSEVESLKTKNPYARIDLKYTRETDYYFTVTAFDENTGVVNGSSDPISAVDPYYDPTVDVCQYVYDGENYAWKLQLKQDYYNLTGIYNPSEEGFLQLNQGFKFVSEGVYSPFYQAIDLINYNQLDPTHPYRQMYNNGNYRYDHIQIDASLAGGPFFDAQNNVVLNGWLIEKKLDQFEHFNYDITNSILPSATFCDMSASGWYETFNNSYGPPSINGVIPAITEFATQYGIPAELTCNTSNGTYTDGGNGDNPFENEFINNVFACWYDNEDLEAYADCLDEDVLTGGQILTDIILIPLDKNGSKHHLQRDPTYGKFVDLDFNSINKNGLYEVQIFTNSQNVFKSIIENVSDKNLVEDKDFVQMSISPNPIENNVMKLNVKTEKDMNAKLVVYTLANVVLYDATV
jgi:hypothetical protein